VDWWSLGALVFEMLVGDPPFVAKDKKKLSEKIMNERVQFPSYLTSACHSLLKGLLERNVEKRLGCAKSTMFKTKGVSELKQHAFFKVRDSDVLLSGLGDQQSLLSSLLCCCVGSGPGLAQS
jgi:ribosomal protein S6 kinase beta